jgi:hypothetical protein
MTRKALAARLGAAFVLALCGVFLLVFARDVWHSARALDDGDALAAVQPVSPSVWNADTVLPGSLVRGVLGDGDDLAFRRAVVGAVDLLRTHGGSGNQHVLVETALARVILTDHDKRRASIAADYLGVLLYDDRNAPQQSISPYDPQHASSPAQSQTPEQKAAAEFETAVRLDPENANAKKNLETLLHQAQPQSQKGTPNAGSGNKTGTKGSGEQPPGYGY